MNMEENIITGIITAIGTFIGYFVGARKNNAETDKIVIENVKEIIDVYTTTLNDLKAEVKQLKEKIIHYEQVIEKLNEEMCQFKKDLKNESRSQNNRRNRASKTTD